MIVYSTNPGFAAQTNRGEEAPDTPPPQKQMLFVGIDRRHRAGKQVTVVSGFTGAAADLEQLCKLLKNKCGAGGSVKEGVILIQGDFREKLLEMLQKMGYKTKRAN